MSIDKQARIRIKNYADSINAHLEDPQVTGVPWQNFTGTVTNKNGLIIDVDNVDMLQQLVKFIVEENQKDENDINFQFVDGYSDKDKLDLDCGCCPGVLSGLVGFFKKNNPIQREYKYNESFNYDQSREDDDVLIRFSKKYISNGVYFPPKGDLPDSVENEFEDKAHMDAIQALPRSRVVVNAGVPFKQFLDKLNSKGKSIATAPPNIFMSPVQAALNGDYGTGRDQPAFNGLVKKIHGIDHLGERITIEEGNKHFEAIRGGKADFFMIPTAMEFEVVDKFRLKEEKESFKNAPAFLAKLQEMITQNEYFTASYVPVYNATGVENIIPNWQVRLWNYSKESKTHNQETSPVEMILESLSHDIISDSKGEIQALLFSQELHDLIPAYMKLAAALTDAIRGDKDVVSSANNIYQYKKAQSDDVFRETFFVPVKTGNEAGLLGEIASFIDDKLDKMGQGDMFTPASYPITYCVNYRFLKGTNGGLSTTHTGEDEHLIAVELVTHKEAPNFALFESAFIDFLNTKRIDYRFALNQTVPASVKGFFDYLGGEAKGLDAFKQALVETYGPLEGIGTSPFISDFDVKMLNNEVANIPRPEVEVPQHSASEVTKYLKFILMTLDPIVKHQLRDQRDELQIAWGEFKRVAHAAIKRYEKHESDKTTVELPPVREEVRTSPSMI